jgi:hypothetical protein
MRMADDERARRREFARRHHPDVGGDPAVFVAGWERLGPPPEERPRVVGLPHRTGLGRLRPIVRRFRGARTVRVR